MSGGGSAGGMSSGGTAVTDGGCPAAVACGARRCGPDPVCGVSCGTCPSNQACLSGFCRTTSAGDPGWGRGTWLPPGSVDTFIVDQSGSNGAGGVTAFPGCINQIPNTVGCPPTYVGTPYNVALEEGVTIGIRVRTDDGGVRAREYFRVTGGAGAGVGTALRCALSTVPGATTTTDPMCTVQGQPGGYPTLFIGDGGCPVDPHVPYYFNVRVTSACSSPYACTYKLLEPASMAN